MKNNRSTIYDGSADRITKTDETYYRKPFFRKLYPIEKKEDDTRDIERKIVEILMNNPHPNIVTFYNVTDKYLDMEQLNTPHSNPKFYDNFQVCKDETPIIIEAMIEVKDFLQNLGIMYIDWKFDNIAKGDDFKYKLFDFDSSGIVELPESDRREIVEEWKVTPPNYWSFIHAKKNNCKTPKQIDDWCFMYNMLKETDILCNYSLQTVASLYEN